MSLNLNGEASFGEKEKSYSKAPSTGMNRSTIREMVRSYRIANKDFFKYAHFNAYDVLSLFVANGILDKSIATAIAAKKDEINQHGLKIYLGCHISEQTLPIGPDALSYLGKVTTILVNTDIIKDPKYGYLYKDKLDDLAVVGENKRDIDPGQGLDQAEVAPPYHIDAPEDEEYDVGFPL